MHLSTCGAGAGGQFWTGNRFPSAHDDVCRESGSFPVFHFIHGREKSNCFATNLFFPNAKRTSIHDGGRMGHNGNVQEGLLDIFSDEHFVEGSLFELLSGIKKDHKTEVESAFSDSWESFLDMFATEKSIHRSLCKSVGALENDQNKGVRNTDVQIISSLSAGQNEVQRNTTLSKTHELENSFELDNLPIEEAFEWTSNLCWDEEPLQRCVSLIQKCKQHGCLATAMRAYSHLCENGLDHNGFLGSYLVAMFVHCWSMPMAEQVFSRLLFRNQYSWTHLMQGYIEVGDREEALHLFDLMIKSGIQPNNFVFVLVLRVCKVLKLVGRGQKIHAEIARSLKEDISITRALLDFYLKCGLFMEANDMINDLHCHQNHVDEDNSQRLYMGLQNFTDPNSFFSDKPSRLHAFALKACSSLQILTKGHEHHIQIVKAGLDQNNYISNTLIDMYAKCGLPSEAFNVLSSMSERNAVSWTALIAGCIENDLYENAWNFLETMKTEGTLLNAFTMCSCLKGCSVSQSLDMGRSLHSQIMKEGLYTDYVVCNSLVSMYAKCGSLEEAHDVFDKLARQDIISWTSLISGYTDCGFYKEAENCFASMIEAGVHPNSVAYTCCLKACTFTVNWHMGYKLHHDLVVEEFEKDVITGNALVHMYAKCGLSSDAKKVFHDLSHRDVVSWTTMISELVEDGQGVQALKMLEQMCKEGLSPNSYTYVCSLKACAISMSIEQGRVLHTDIIKKGLERIPFISKALNSMYGACGKPITLSNELND